MFRKINSALLLLPTLLLPHLALAAEVVDPNVFDLLSFIFGLSFGLLLFFLFMCILIVVSAWMIFTKAGKPGWAALIPIYNIIIFLDIIDRPRWLLLVFFAPTILDFMPSMGALASSMGLASLIVAIITTNDLAKSFGKGIGFTVGLLLLPGIFHMILAFGGSKYVGRHAGTKAH